MEQQALSVLRFFSASSYQDAVVTDQHLGVTHRPVSVAVRQIVTEILCHLISIDLMIYFLWDNAAKASVKVGFLLHRNLDGIFDSTDCRLLAIRTSVRLVPKAPLPTECHDGKCSEVVLAEHKN